MKDFSLNIDLLEQTDLWYFTIDWKDQKDYLYKHRCGLLQRKFNAHRLSNSIELSSFSDARAHIAHSVTSTALKPRSKEVTFNPSKALRENEMIFNTLRQLNLKEWKVIFRANHTSRIIFEKGYKEKKTEFTYFSILIKMKLKDQDPRKFIEIGEGSILSSRFNQDGIISRIKKITENHLNRRPHHFSEKVPVILNAGDGAIIFHELLGHSLEADYIYHHQSPITIDHLDKPLMSPNVTILTRDENDTFFKDIPCDDEGKTASSDILVEKGVLKHFISDCFYKDRLNIQDSGHSRTEDFTKMPMPRMYALYVKSGDYHPDELIASTPYGVYAGEFGEGKVNFEKNLFYFHIREAWLIEKGKLTAPLGSIIMRGNISEVLNSVEMVGNDFRYDKGISYCFKNGQALNVRVGQPSVKIKNLQVTREFGF